MARFRQSRRSGRRRTAWILSSAGALAVGSWWLFLRPLSTPAAPNPLPLLTTERPESVDRAELQPGVSEKGQADPVAATESAATALPRAQSLVAAGKQAIDRNDLVGARTYLSEAVGLGLEEPDRTIVRAELTRIATDTVFSPRVLEHDPLVSRHIIQPGDTLGKIAKAHKISPELLAAINGITDPNRIRAGQAVKLLTGPFHVFVFKKTFTLDVYLGTTFVRQFKVGLGADDSTPKGEWHVGTKLKNPTYYPPRGGKIIAADDPENPLAEYWIGLVGVSGEAAGQDRYGIHGTIDPESIGKSISMGCIRMYNEDVEVLYSYLVEKHSTVTVRD